MSRLRYIGYTFLLERSLFFDFTMSVLFILSNQAYQVFLLVFKAILLISCSVAVPTKFRRSVNFSINSLFLSNLEVLPMSPACSCSCQKIACVLMWNYSNT